MEKNDVKYIKLSLNYTHKDSYVADTLYDYLTYEFKKLDIQVNFERVVNGFILFYSDEIGEKLYQFILNNFNPSKENHFDKYSKMYFSFNDERIFINSTDKRMKITMESVIKLVKKSKNKEEFLEEFGKMHLTS